jgi:hypothetical protein
MTEITDDGITYGVIWNGTMEREGTAPRIGFWVEDFYALAAGRPRPDVRDRLKATTHHDELQEAA